jgi:hypothetical protein
MINAKTNNAGKNYEPVPQGNHIGRCISMLELGTVSYDWQGEKKQLHKVRITWELPLETKVFHEEKGEQPFIISKEYTLSMHEKSNLRKDLESWRGQPFTEKEAESFDITKLLEKPCMINVVHAHKDGNTYANVTSITPIPKGMVCPPQINPTFVLSYDEFDFNKFDTLPTWLKEKMSLTPEFQRVSSPKTVQEAKQVNALPSSQDLPF